MINNFQTNQNQNLINKSNDDYIYVLVFNAVTNLTNSGKSNEIKIKIIRKIINIFENIIKAELNKYDSKNYRKIKVTDPNISLIFDIKGMYDFFKSLGFNEKYFGEDLCLYLPRNNINTSLFYKLISFIQLLSLNFQDINNSQNYYEINNQNNQNIVNFINNNNSNNNNFNNNQFNNNNIRIIHFKIMGNNNMNLENNFFMVNIPNAQISKHSNNNNNINNWNIINNNNNVHSNIHSHNNFNQNQFNNNCPNINNNIFCNDEIGKKCFLLTNNFREKNNLPPLKWDNSIWRISYTHSKNMGDQKVPFGHSGFNQRISQFPFSYNMACENVFMCLGRRDNKVAFEVIKGWINSPGHRKNILSKTTHCAIATYIASNGVYYLTQMFANKLC